MDRAHSVVIKAYFGPVMIDDLATQGDALVMQRATHFDINSQVRPPANMLILMSPILRYGQNLHGKVLGMAVRE